MGPTEPTLAGPDESPGNYARQRMVAQVAEAHAAALARARGR